MPRIKAGSITKGISKARDLCRMLKFLILLYFNRKLVPQEKNIHLITLVFVRKAIKLEKMTNFLGFFFLYAVDHD